MQGWAVRRFASRLSGVPAPGRGAPPSGPAKSLLRRKIAEFPRIRRLRARALNKLKDLFMMPCVERIAAVQHMRSSQSSDPAI